LAENTSSGLSSFVLFPNLEGGERSKAETVLLLLRYARKREERVRNP